MVKKQAKDEFELAEAMSQIKSAARLPDEAIEKMAGEELSDDIDTPEAFRTALGVAQMDELEYIEVGEKLFNYLVKNQKTPYLTYGEPGIKIYKKGTRVAIEKEESMKAEDRYTLICKRSAEEAAKENLG